MLLYETYRSTTWIIWVHVDTFTTSPFCNFTVASGCVPSCEIQFLHLALLIYRDLIGPKKTQTSIDAKKSWKELRWLLRSFFEDPLPLASIESAFICSRILFSSTLSWSKLPGTRLFESCWLSSSELSQKWELLLRLQLYAQLCYHVPIMLTTWEDICGQ